MSRCDLLLYMAAVFAGFAVGQCTQSHARDNGWPDTPTNIRQWYQSLMQPDNPAISCCGEADAYEADDFAIEGDHYVAIITDERPDTFPNGVTRQHIEPGTRISVPNTKMKWDAGNPTGHGMIFIGGSGTLYCYVVPGGGGCDALRPQMGRARRGRG